MKLKNKFVLITIILILLIFTLSCSSFANSFPMSDGSSLEISAFPEDFSSYKYYILLFDNPSEYYFILWDDDAIDYFVCDFSPGIQVLKFRDASGNSDFEGDVGIYCYTYQDGHLVKKDNFSKFSSLNITYYYDKGGYSSNVDLCYDNSSEVVFPGAPLPIQMVEPMEVSKVEELPTLVIQIVEIIIPVFLIIFGTLLVLYLIKSKNLLQL